MDEHVLEHLVEGGVAPEIAVQRAAEQAVLDEEIRKRREKVKAWQEAKRLKEEQEKIAAGEVLASNAAESSSETKAQSGDEHAETSQGGDSAAEASAAADNSETSLKPHGWNLEDDDEEEEEEGVVENATTSDGVVLGEEGAAPPPHALSATEEETDAFQRLAATPVKPHTDHANLSHGLAHVTAVSLAASVSGMPGTAPTGGVPAGVSASSLGGKRRMSRLKASKWDSDTHGDGEDAVETPVPVPNGVHSTAPITLSSPAAPATASMDVQVADAEEEDPLEAFMSSLYESGDVAEQRALPATRVPHLTEAAAASHALPKTITLEDILAGNVPEGVADPPEQHVTGEQHPGRETPPSPQFAPALKNYPSSSSLMAKSPSLRALSAAAATSFDNLNRGWESDAADTGDNFSVGIAGMDDADSVDDNGEVPWHMMSSKDKKKERQERGDQQGSSSNGNVMDVETGSATTAAAASGHTGYSESESEQENAETEAEREAREIREKQVYCQY